MKKIIMATLALSFFLLAGPVTADILEVRVGYGVSSANPDDFNQNLGPGAGDVLDVSNLNSYNIDLFANIPFFPIGAGLRYEAAQADNDSSINGTGINSEVDVEIISVLLDWRVIDTVAYLGPIISVGQASGDLDVTTTGTTTNFDLEENGLAWSVGAEGGVNLKGWIIGAEAGYRKIPLKKVVDVDLDGVYGKIMIGRGFF